MPLYPYETQLALNPDATGVVVTDASVTIYDPSDTAMTSPLTLVDATGIALPNPLPVTPQGFLPAFQATVPQIMWAGGGAYGYLSSYKGLLDEASNTRLSAVSAAGNALNAQNAALAAQAAAESAAVAPTDAVVDSRIAAAGAASKWKPSTAYLLGQYVISPDGNLVKAKLSHTSGASYSAADWDAGASALSSVLPLNVKDSRFGAIGDGVADDTLAIQAALDAVPVGGGAVYMPAGRYKVTAQLKVTQDGTTWYGDGTGMRAGATQDSRATRIEAAAGVTGSIVLVQRVANDRPLHGVSLRDFAIDGGGLGTAVDGVIFRVNMGHMDRVNIWRASGAGLRVLGYTSPAWDTYDSMFTNLTIGNCLGAGAIVDAKAADTHWSHCVFLYNQDNYIIKSAAGQVTGCHFYAPERYNIWFDGGGSRSKFANCKIEGAKDHMVLMDSTNGGYSDVQFTGNGFSSLNQQLADNTYDYVLITGPSANAITRTLFVGNSFNIKGGATVKPRYAINLDGSAAAGTVITANTFGSSTHWGTAPIRFAGSSSVPSYVKANYGVPDFGNTSTTIATSYTLTAADADTVVDMNSATPVTVTIPPVSSVPWNKGTTLDITQMAAGQVTIAPGSGVTLRTPRSLTTRAQYSTISLRMRGSNEWVLSGDLT